MNKSVLKFSFPIFAALGVFTLVLLNTTVFADVAGYSASGFSQYCASNTAICKKVDFDNKSAGQAYCPSVSQKVSEVYVHAGDGQTVYKLPDNGFGYMLNGNSASVWLTTHPHMLSWIGVVCVNSTNVSPSPTFAPSPKPSETPCPKPSPSPSPKPTPVVSPTPGQSPTPVSSPSLTPTPSPSPSPDESPAPSPSPSLIVDASPSPSPTVVVINNTVNNSNDQNQEQKNNQTVNVLGASTVKTTPETGVGTAAMAGMFSMTPIGFVLSKFRRNSKDPFSSFASSVYKKRNG